MGAINDKRSGIEEREHATSMTREYMIARAVRQQSVPELRHLIKYIDLNMTLASGNSLLVYMIKQQSYELVKLLVDEGVDVNMEDDTGSRPLHTAILTRTPSLVSLLLDAGSDVTLQERTGLNALHVTCIKGPVEVARSVMSAGVKVDQTTNNVDRLTACMIAASQGQPECLDALLQAGANPDISDPSGATALQFAITNDHLECVKILVVHNAKVNLPNRCGLTPYQVATMRDCCDILKFLISSSCVNFTKYSQDLTPLAASAMNACVQCAGAMIDVYVNIEMLDKYKRTPLFYAIVDMHKIEHLYQCFNIKKPSSRLEIAKYLINRGASVTKPWKTKFWDSRSKGPDVIATYKLMIRASGSFPVSNAVLQGLFEKICSFGCFDGVQLMILAGFRPVRDLDHVTFGRRTLPCQVCSLEQRRTSGCDELCLDSIKQWLASMEIHPASLKHICRTVLRETLSPNVIYCCNNLNIPTEIRDTICFEPLC